MDLIETQGEQQKIETAFREMCTESRKNGKLVKGFRQITKSLISGRSKLILMSSAIKEEGMKAVIEGLSKQNNVPILRVNSHQDLAAYVGLVKESENEEKVKILSCAVASIEDFGKKKEASAFLLAQTGKQE